MRKTVKRFGAGAGGKGHTITELYALVQASEEQSMGIDALCGDEAASCLIIRDLLAEIRRLKTKLVQVEKLGSAQ